ncbi:hypothetical protein ACSBR2_004857 [Camellia fascicularis]
MAARKPGLITLLDVDGTLNTAPRKAVTPDMLNFMKELRKVFDPCLEPTPEELFINDYDYVFAENGLVAHKDGKLIGTQSLKTCLGEEKLKIAALQPLDGSDGDQGGEEASHIFQATEASTVN